jgi:hypothetical protein
METKQAAPTKRAPHKLQKWQILELIETVRNWHYNGQCTDQELADVIRYNLRRIDRL